jgi:glucokinase
MQGEVGHFVVPPVFDGKLGDFVCDCGGRNHLNAMCSGRGIDRVLSRVLEHRRFSENEHPVGLLAPDQPPITGLLRCLVAGRAAAHEILAAVVAPVARIVAEHLCLDPELEKIFLVGGTLVALEPFYREALLCALAETQTYLISQFDPDYFRRTLQFCVAGEISSLDGAALLAHEDNHFHVV